jgi:putative ABC transport system permease protein
MFPVFYVSAETVMMQVAASAAVGILAGVLPSIRASRVKIVDGLRYAG